MPRSAAPGRPETRFLVLDLVLVLRPRDTGDMRTMVEEHERPWRPDERPAGIGPRRPDANSGRCRGAGARTNYPASCTDPTNRQLSEPPRCMHFSVATASS